MRRRRFVNTIGVIFILFAALLIYAAVPGRSTFTISPQTTYVTDRLDKKGFVDYPTALNDRLSNGITPETNANVLIWKALGPKPEGGNGMPAEYFKMLGIDPPTEKGDYLVGYSNYLKDHGRVDSAQNADEDYDKLFRAGHWPWTGKEYPELAGWLAANEKPLALIVEATRRPEYYNPIVPNRTEDWSPGLIAALLPNVQKCREVGSALTCRAMLRVGDGKYVEAWQDLLACHRLARHVGRGGTIIESLVGFALEQIAARADVVFLERAKFTSAQILACLKDVRDLPPVPAVADKVDLVERFACLDGMMLVIRQGRKALEGFSGGGPAPPPSDSVTDKLFQPSINWDPAFRNANRWFDRYAAAMRVPDRATRQQQLADLTSELKQVRSNIHDPATIKKAVMGSEERGEIAGDIVITLMLPALEKVQNAADRCEQNQRNLQLAFALAAFRADQGRYSAKLDELAPKYIEKIPDDLFAEKPLIYRLEGAGYLLYSVGPDGKDDGGRGQEDEPRGDDIAIRVPTPEPKIKK